MTVKCATSFPLPLPDDPKKWDGWSKYKSPNYYERLCLDPRANPSNEVIEEHCRELLRWWQKKLPLKNQPSNPLAQMLRSGLEESSRFLTEARVELLDPNRRRALDDELASQAHEEAMGEFQRFLAFVIADGTLTAAQEKNLVQFGAEQGLTTEQMTSSIEAELEATGAKRVQPPPARPAGAGRSRRSLNPRDDFLRMLRLSALNSDEMTDDQRDAFVNMAENLGIDPGDAEDLVDSYLDEADGMNEPATSAPPPVAAAAPRVEVVEPPKQPETEETAPEEVVPTMSEADERAHYINYENSVGSIMLLVPSGSFVMGSEDVDAAPNERPLTRVSLSRYYLSRHPITNGQYEQFDPSHARKRAAGTGDRHPVVYVSSLEAIKFCQWLSSRERKKYRLPTEAEWEYAARGNDGRRYPWGNFEGRGDLANFADKNTVFAWSDHDVDDGFPESSPVGSFPNGTSPFGIEDMAGNVWEWCLDFYEPYRGVPRVNPHGPATGAKRVYRGGSWKSRFNSLRATARGSNLPNFSCNDLGFRIVCECD